MESAGAEAILCCLIVNIFRCDHRLSSQSEEAVSLQLGKIAQRVVFRRRGTLSRVVLKYKDY